MTIRRPFCELDLCDQLRFEPHTVFSTSLDEPDFGRRQRAEMYRSHKGGVSDTFSVLLDDSIRPVKHLRRNCQADLIRGHQVNHQLELHRLLYG